MRIKRFNEDVNNSLIKIISEEDYEECDTIGYDFSKIENIIDEQTKKLIGHFYDDFYYSKNDGFIKSNFRDIDMLIEFYAIEDDYFLCHFIYRGYYFYLKIDTVDGFSNLADFIIQNESKLN